MALTRISSYNSWRLDITPTPQSLAAAGFFYLGENNDAVRCHYCDGGVKSWTAEKDPWVIHAQFFPYCKYLIKMQGADFITDAANNLMVQRARGNQEYITQHMGGFVKSAESEDFIHSQEFKTDEIIKILLETYSINTRISVISAPY
ncbi:MAG: hypothetical protein QS748_14725 [Candidatus Endonucleobacter bathymodioli]|uniref:Uncharacterized protein n=1 Tax=Candidatus Endonucleibacter bathymodioli TaxID=539814 RepID=A0AA90SDF8_9GAMM|nr:hypothetical protein [Candidatus Endonucleobacter bathymodioli]MDP0590367.1 hypothetical protein [Candidatus Endonucleobacter bathymodioli]